MGYGGCKKNEPESYYEGTIYDIEVVGTITDGWSDTTISGAIITLGWDVNPIVVDDDGGILVSGFKSGQDGNYNIEYIGQIGPNHSSKYLWVSAEKDSMNGFFYGPSWWNAAEDPIIIDVKIY